MCPGPESNRHGDVIYRGILSPLRLPISPPGRFLDVLFTNRGWHFNYRLSPESNRGTRLCRPLHNHSATQPDSFTVFTVFTFGAGNETRTRDPNLGKVMLYQLSYSRLKKSLAYARGSLFCYSIHTRQSEQTIIQSFYLLSIVKSGHAAFK